MIQDIYPSKLNNCYMDYKMTANDYVLWFNAEGKAYVRIKEEQIGFATGSDMKEASAVYLFSVDEKKYFLALGEVSFLNSEYGYYSVRELRDRCSGKELFAVFSAYHLWRWYTDNQYCGRCADRLEPGKKERSLICPSCGNVVYPRINPAVIVGVIKGDKILITDQSEKIQIFRVYANVLIDADDFSDMLEILTENTLVLLTCEDEAPDGAYLHRRVILAERK